jgi:hypothetical protein
MADQEVRSPNTSLASDPTRHPRRGETGSMHRGPFVDRRDDSGAPWKPCADQNAPVVGQSPGVMQDRGRRV